MSTISIIIFIIGLLNIMLGFFVFQKNRQSSSNKWFFLMCLFGGGWGIIKAVQLSWMNIYWNEHLIVKLIYILGILAPFAYLLLAYNFPYKVKVYNKKIGLLVYLIPLVLVFLVIIGVLKKENDFIINNTLHREINFYDFLIFAIYFFTYVFTGFIVLLKKYFLATDIFKLQIKYLIIATIGTFLTTGFVSVVLLLFNNFTYDWLGPIFLLIHFSFIGYLIFIKNR